jgi:hypothetical protein
MTDTTEWRIRYENTNPHRERTRADLVSLAVAPGRFQHELRTANRSTIEEFRVLAVRGGANNIRVDQRTIVRTVGEWCEAVSEAARSEGSAPCRSQS